MHAEAQAELPHLAGGGHLHLPVGHAERGDGRIDHRHRQALRVGHMFAS
jgi:hypothetical protein